MFMLHVHYGMAEAQLCTIPTPRPRLMEQPLPETLVSMAKGTLNHTLYHEAAKASLGSDICLFCSHFISQSKWPRLTPRGREVKFYHVSGRLGSIWRAVQMTAMLSQGVTVRVNWLNIHKMLRKVSGTQ